MIELLVIDHERAFVGHEMLEGVDAIGLHHRFHLIEDLLVPPGYRHMEGIIRGRLLCLTPPVLIGGEHRLLGGRNAEIDDHRRAAGKGGLGAPLEIIRRYGTHEHELHMSMGINAARHHIEAAGIDDFDLAGRLELLTYRDDAAFIDQHIGAPRVIMVHHRSAADENGHEKPP